MSHCCKWNPTSIKPGGGESSWLHSEAWFVHLQRQNNLDSVWYVKEVWKNMHHSPRFSEHHSNVCNIILKTCWITFCSMERGFSHRRGGYRKQTGSIVTAAPLQFKRSSTLSGTDPCRDKSGAKTSLPRSSPSLLLPLASPQPATMWGRMRLICARHMAILPHSL